MPRLLVTGASGLLGVNLCLVAAQQGYDVTGWVHSRSLRGVPFEVQTVNLLDEGQTLAQLAATEADAIIHCAAVANVNAAEQSPDLAQQLNGQMPGILAAAAAERSIPFIHISTDAVFNGQHGDYAESDPVDPLSIYARTKLAGERAAQAANADAMIVRTVFYGWSLSGKRSLAEFFFNHLIAGECVNGFADTYFCPLYVEDLAETLLEMLKAGLQGVYHVVSPESLSKYAFGVQIARQFGLDPHLVIPTRATDLDRGAARSLNLTLKPDKVQTALGHTLPNIADGITRFHARGQDGYSVQLRNYLFG